MTTQLIKKLLIANRGEIACRIIKTAKKLKIKTVAIYSEIDANSLHVRMADQAVYIGPSPVASSYLNQNAIMNAVEISGADAVHPGYGFLSENASFADRVIKSGIIFVGPTADAITKMGDKIQAKKLAQKSGVNVVPGYMGVIANVKDALKIASKIGYPIMIKAAAGGGGMGIRTVRSPEEMKQAFVSAQNEARNFFADSRTFIEKYIEKPRHIEVQILGDKYGNYVCLGERECSIQRNHQKVVEEAPSIALSTRLRKKMYKQSIDLAKTVGYFSAGTIEFMLDTNDNFYFLEMNTRLQVEHPVTELITGYDIVEQMIRIAQGERLEIKQKDVTFNGWAMEARVYAEDPTAGFLPSAGVLSTYEEPNKSPNIRIDTGIYEGGEISIYYDPLISKLCTHNTTRDTCIKTMVDALSSYVIRGISHNLGFLEKIFLSPRFVAGDISTHYILEEFQDKQKFTSITISTEETAVILSAASFVFFTCIRRNASVGQQIRNQQKRIGTRWVILLDNMQYQVAIRQIDGGYKITSENSKLYITSNWILGSTLFQCTINGQNYNLQLESFNEVEITLAFRGSRYTARILTPRAAELNKFMIQKIQCIQDNDIKAGISGLITEIKVKEGEQVKKGQVVMVMEAMKMENFISCPRDCIVRKIPISVGQPVGASDILMELEVIEK